MNLVLATNTEWTMVTSKSCEKDDGGCVKGVYDPDLSQNETIHFEPIMQNVDLGDEFSVYGQNASDVFYMKDGVTMIAKDFPFFLITSVTHKKTKKLFPFDGVCGLSPDISGGDTYFTLGQPVPLYLKKVGKIKQAVVGIDMHSDTAS